MDGLVFGLVCLTKVEIVFAGALVLAAAAIQRPSRSGAAAVAGTAAAVVAAAWALLATQVSARDAFVAATGGFLGPLLYPAYVTSSTILGYIGLNRPAENLAAIARWELEGGAAVGLLTAGAGWRRNQRRETGSASRTAGERARGQTGRGRNTRSGYGRSAGAAADSTAPRATRREAAPGVRRQARGAPAVQRGWCSPAGRSGGRRARSPPPWRDRAGAATR